MEQEKNNLMQEELLFKQQPPTEVPPEIEKNLDAFIYALEYQSDEGILRKFAFGYVVACLFVLLFFHQLGAGFFSFDIGSVLNFMGTQFKQLIVGMCFSTIVISSVLVVSFNDKELEILLAMKNKTLYTLIIFTWIFMCMFGNEFTWIGALLWIIGASFGAGLGFNFGEKYIKEKMSRES